MHVIDFITITTTSIIIIIISSRIAIVTYVLTEIKERKNRNYRNWNQLEYLGESWKAEETCYHSNFSEKPPTKTSGKKWNILEIIIIIIWEKKQLHGRFKRLINNISHDKTWTWLRKGNFKRETESLLMAAQNSAIKTNHIKAMIDKTQQNSKCRLCGDRDETINPIISECSKLARKE